MGRIRGLPGVHEPTTDPLHIALRVRGQQLHDDLYVVITAPTPEDSPLRSRIALERPPMPTEQIRCFVTEHHVSDKRHYVAISPHFLLEVTNFFILFAPPRCLIAKKIVFLRPHNT